MKSTSKYKAVLFDFDGTLVDSWQAVYETMLKTFQYFNPGKDASHIKLIRNNHNNYDASFKFVFQSENVNKEIIKYAEELYLNIVVERTQAFPGVSNVISFLREEQIPWGIVTTKQKQFVEKILANIDFFQDARSVVCIEDVLNPKPHPEGLLKACKEMDLLVSETIYIGDSGSDIQAAKNCLMDSGCATYGYIRDIETAKEWCAEYYLNNIEDVIDILS